MRGPGAGEGSPGDPAPGGPRRAGAGARRGPARSAALGPRRSRPPPGGRCVGAPLARGRRPCGCGGRRPRPVGEAARADRSAEPRHRGQPLGDARAGVGPPPAASVARTKRMGRTVLQERLLDTTPAPPAPRLTRHWPGGGPTALRVPRHRVGPPRAVTAPEVLARRGALAKVGQDQTSAAPLQRVGYRPAPGQTGRAHRGARRRSTPRLPHVAQGQEGLPRAHAAPPLGGRAPGLRRRRRPGPLPARQGVPWAPWLLHASALALRAGQTAVPAVPGGRRSPGRRPRPPAGPGRGASPAGDAPAMASPAAACRRQLMAGEPCGRPCVSHHSSDVCSGGWRPRRSGPVACSRGVPRSWGRRCPGLRAPSGTVSGAESPRG